MALASMPDRRLWSIVAVSWNYIARQNYLRANGRGRAALE